MGDQQLRDPVFGAISHFVRLQGLRLRHAMLDAQRLAQRVDPTGGAFSALANSEHSSRELLALVHMHAAESHRAARMQRLQQATRVGGGRACADLGVDPARSALDLHNQTARLGLLGHPWQAQHVTCAESPACRL